MITWGREHHWSSTSLIVIFSAGSHHYSPQISNNQGLFHKQNKYQILYHISSGEYTHNSVYQIYTCSVKYFSFDGINFQWFEFGHELVKVHIVCLQNIFTHMLLIAWRQRYQHSLNSPWIRHPVIVDICQLEVDVIQPLQMSLQTGMLLHVNGLELSKLSELLKPQFIF